MNRFLLSITKSSVTYALVHTKQTLPRNNPENSFYLPSPRPSLPPVGLRTHQSLLETSRSDPGAQTTYWKRFLEAVSVATRFRQAARAFLQAALHPWLANNDTDSQHALSILICSSSTQRETGATCPTSRTRGPAPPRPLLPPSG